MWSGIWVITNMKRLRLLFGSSLSSVLEEVRARTPTKHWAKRRTKKKTKSSFWFFASLAYWSFFIYCPDFIKHELCVEFTYALHQFYFQAVSYCPLKRLYIGFQFISLLCLYFYVLSPMPKNMLLHLCWFSSFVLAKLACARAHQASKNKRRKPTEMKKHLCWFSSFVPFSIYTLWLLFTYYILYWSY